MKKILFAVIMAFVLLAQIGCRTHDKPFVDEFPVQIQSQCVKAKAESIKWAQSRNLKVPSYGVHVKGVLGTKWGSQWAIMQGGQLVGGYCQGGNVTIGRGPNWEINYGDLFHEFKEWASYGNGEAHK